MDDLLDRYVQEYGYSQHLIDSYNWFITVAIPDIIQQQRTLYIGPIGIDQKECQLTILKHEFVLPCKDDAKSLYPFEARARNVTYSAALMLEYRRLEKVKGEVQKDITEKVCVAHIPVMYGSILCHMYKASPEKLIQHKEAINDISGYFIIKGAEKMIISQERMTYNQIYIFGPSESSDPYSPADDAYDYFAEIRSIPEGFQKVPVQLLIRYYNRGTIAGGGGLSNSGPLRVKLPYARSGAEIPLFILFYGLGITNDKSIFESVCKHCDPQVQADLQHALLPSLEDALSSLQEDGPVAKLNVQELVDNALDYIGRKNVNAAAAATRTDRLRIAKDHLLRDVFPHLYYGINRQTDNIDIMTKMLQKAQYLGQMTQKLLLTAQKRQTPNNRDHLAYKRIDTAGSLCATLFRTNFRKFNVDLKRYITKLLDMSKPVDLPKAISGIKSITSGLVSAIATGNWSDNQTFNTKVGISQSLNRYNMGATLSHARRINNAVKREGKASNPRLLHGSQLGFICPAETPEGAQCGLVKTQALCSRITIPLSSELLYDFLIDKITMAKYTLTHYFDDVDNHKLTCRININGAWMLTMLDTTHMIPLVTQLRKLRRIGAFSGDLSVSYSLQDPEIFLWTDGGRLLRPLIILEHFEQLTEADRSEWQWKDYLSNHIVEFVDVAEIETLLIGLDLDSARQNKCTHLEIKSGALLSVAAGLIPFANHNQSPRNVYSSAMSKQGMGMPLENYQQRSDANMHILHYPQKPMVYTKTAELCGIDSISYGCNAIVAIACYTGYNQEDSIIMNQSSIDRGLFVSTSYKTHVETEKKETLSTQEQKLAPKDKHTVIHEAFDIPDPETTLDMKRGASQHLDDDGLPSPGQRLLPNDVIVAKTTKLRYVDKNNPNLTRRDTSTIIKASDVGIVDRVTLCSSSDHVKSTKITVRSLRVPEIGDKHSSRHGQKGTIGMTYRQEDMPFTQNGIIPDLMINPNAIPSRMTVGHLLETVLGKQAALDGKMKEASMQLTHKENTHTVESIADALKTHNYQHRGYEVMYDPRTGRKFKSSVFIGPIYYLKLKHMVQDKIHSRARGQLQLLTKQPVEGRSKDGGLRFGEMERKIFLFSLFLTNRSFCLS